jgi:kinesin family protein 4/21/27
METGEDCCVKVAVHVRPLIADEKLQGCKDCVTVVAGKPQVQSLSIQQCRSLIECEK